ncbi:MAG: FAD:protein FMN transferase [Desulfomonilaceae bacterium]|nr:FAD:protein FMN transferase [Desulfomonilaceae bacterium]
MRRQWLSRIAVPACMTVLFCSCTGGPSGDLHKETRFLMGTFVEVTVKGPAQEAKRAVGAVFDEMKRVEELTSFHTSSGLTQVNASAGQGSVQADPELATLVGESLSFARETDGAFDPTLGPLAKLWNFSAGEPRLPEDSEIKAALDKRGWQHVTVDASSGTITLPREQMSLDLGGIAKGYSLDRARLVLVKLGVQSALINAGGDILAVGEKSPGHPWRIGVQDPRNPNGLVAVATLRDRVIVTSGDYERFFVHEGKRYHHILNPETGYPAGGLRSVTIIAADGVRADAMATAVFGLGAKRGLEYVEKTPDVEGFLIDANGEMFFTSGAADLIQTTDGQPPKPNRVNTSSRSGQPFPFAGTELIDHLLVAIPCLNQRKQSG